MSPKITDTRRRGRPQRPALEDIRTVVWAQSVCTAAGKPLRELEPLLGRDGRWNGLWSRYARGLVSPSEDRIVRINAKLPGTRRYFDSPLWILIENGDFTRSELLDSALWLGKLFRDMFVSDMRQAKGPFWRNRIDPFATLVESTRLIGYQPHGLDAMTSLLIVLRESELMQDAWLYLSAMRAWAVAAHGKNQHPVLKRLPERFFAVVAEPLRRLKFQDQPIQAYWRTHLEHYCAAKKTKLARCDLIGALVALDLAQIDAARTVSSGALYLENMR